MVFFTNKPPKNPKNHCKKNQKNHWKKPWPTIVIVHYTTTSLSHHKHTHTHITNTNAPTHPHTPPHTDVCLYVYVCVCVSLCLCLVIYTWRMSRQRRALRSMSAIPLASASIHTCIQTWTKWSQLRSIAWAGVLLIISSAHAYFTQLLILTLLNYIHTMYRGMNQVEPSSWHESLDVIVQAPKETYDVKRDLV